MEVYTEGENKSGKVTRKTYYAKDEKDAKKYVNTAKMLVMSGLYKSFTVTCGNKILYRF